MTPNIITTPPINNSLVGFSPNKNIAASNPVGGIPIVTIGNTLYKGLSLQHVHRQYSNGSSTKHPIEVSICTEPRRENCYIRAVSETKKTTKFS